MYVRMYLCVCMYLCMYVCVCVHTHTHQMIPKVYRNKKKETYALTAGRRLAEWFTNGAVRET